MPTASPSDTSDHTAAPHDELAPAATGCPVRKLVPADERTGPAVEHVGTGPDEVWIIRSFEVARRLIRDSESVRQAGFGAEQVQRAANMRPPVLYLEGSAHRAQRKAAARFFAPKVTEDYREMMHGFSDGLVAQVRPDRSVDLSQLSLTMAVQVASQVIGLTNSSLAGMTRRLDAFLEPEDEQPGGWWLLSKARALMKSSNLLRFFWLDVKPAIRARRKARREDVISQLIDSGFSDFDILTECVTYGAAGMATTREFITVAAWHMLDDPSLLARYRAAEMAERLDILHETLRLEPVIGHLHRRTTAPVSFSAEAQTYELPVGSLIDLDIRAINADASTVGADPVRLCPGRELPRSVPPTLMSFGDGNHRCPGGPLAIMESEIFLTTLLRHDLVADGPPSVRWNPVTQGYDLDSFQIRLA